MTWTIRIALAVGILTALLGGAVVGIAGVNAQEEATAYRWDIFKFATRDPYSFGEGGIAYAFAQDGTVITLTGSGTFQLDDPAAVTGGGTWITFPEHGLRPTGEGTYTVTELISFVEAPGTIPPVITDVIGERTDARGGLAVLRVAFADAEGNPAGEGLLTLSSRLPFESPAVMFDGMTVTRGYVAYWDRHEPVRDVDANRVVFHQLGESGG